MDIKNAHLAYQAKSMSSFSLTTIKYGIFSMRIKLQELLGWLF